MIQESTVTLAKSVIHPSDISHDLSHPHQSRSKNRNTIILFSDVDELKATTKKNKEERDEIRMTKN